MTAVIRFLAQLEIPIYIILGIVAVVYLRRLMLSLDERRLAVFGLEKDAAQAKISLATTILILIGLLTMAEFVIATFLAEKLNSQVAFSTPTVVVTKTATPTATPGEAPDDATETPTPYPQANIEGVESNCVQGVLEITQPKHQDSVKGVVEIKGSVNTPAFGSYKYEYSLAGRPNWQTIAAGSEAGVNKSLGFWYTNSLDPASYMLRLIALDNQGNEQSSCVIIVKVESLN
ncbi:MAG: hypothetical protein VB108_11765 [Anaerolineaceae bacterium]|nr:hypothetical protein [Anaerolineaceae bacterium]